MLSETVAVTEVVLRFERVCHPFKGGEWVKADEGNITCKESGCTKEKVIIRQGK